MPAGRRTCQQAEKLRNQRTPGNQRQRMLRVGQSTNCAMSSSLEPEAEPVQDATVYLCNPMRRSIAPARSRLGPCHCPCASSRGPTRPGRTIGCVWPTTEHLSPFLSCIVKYMSASPKNTGPPSSEPKPENDINFAISSGWDRSANADIRCLLVCTACCTFP